jgi:uncharacterized protein (TIGR00255 family)
MIHSMTGYASITRDLPQGALGVELRSVNHRYFDVSFRMPDDLRAIEPALRDLLAQKVNRGKIDCRIFFSASTSSARAPVLDEALVAQLLELESQIRARSEAASRLSVADILRWPGALGSEEVPVDVMRSSCLELLATAMDDFTASRRREGGKLAALVLERVSAIEAVLAQVRPRLPAIVDAHREKLATRFREALGSADDERIRQELTLFATRIDVDEEFSRLAAHLSEVRRILGSGGVVGKRLDFLMQELNREANTFGSKSVDVETTRASMELKVLIEQMREQIQNIE